LNILGLSGAAGTMTIAGTTLEFSGSAPVINDSETGSAQTIISAPIDLGANLTIQGSSSRPLNLSGLISDSGSLTISNASAAVTISGASNTYSGGTTVTLGGLLTSATGAVGSGAISLGGNSKWTIETVAQSYSNNITVTSTGTTIDGQNTATLSGTVSLGGQLILRDANNAGTARSISGLISGTGSIVKNDAGSSTAYWVLSNNNTYSGATSVNQGELAVTGTTSGQGSYAVGSLSGVSGTLSGNGTIGLAAGKTVTIGNSSSQQAYLAPTDATGSSTTIGTLTFNWASANAANAVNIGTASNIGELFLNIGSAGSSGEIVVGSSAVAGAFNINGNTSTLALSGTFDGSNYVVANYFGTLTGFFGTLVVNGTQQASDTSFTSNGYSYNVEYGVADADGGSDIELLAAPEPSVTLLLGVGLLGFGLLRWIRRRESSVKI
jgi:autotransporter-associated beta strand protein